MKSRSQQRRSTPTSVGGRTKPCMLSADYVVGLTDGEGSFCVYLRPPAKSTWNTRVECHFYLKMRKDELPLLKKVRNFFECGRISYQKEYRQNQQDNYRFQVSNIKDLREKVIPFFCSNLLHSTPRKKDFNIFCKVVGYISNGEHRTKKGMRLVAKLKSQMHIYGLAGCGKSARPVGNRNPVLLDQRNSARHVKRVGNTRTSP